MKAMLRWLGIAVAIILAAYFVRFASEALSRYDFSVMLEPKLLIAIALATFLYALIIPISGWAWHILLRGMGQHWKTSRLATVMGVAQIAKYVPGNVGQHVGRTTLALALGMPLPFFVTSVLGETLLAMSAGLVVGVVCVLLSSTAVPDAVEEHLWGLGLLAGLLVLMVLSFPAVLSAVSQLLARFSVSKHMRAMGANWPNLDSMGIAFIAYSANYLLIGLGLWLIAFSIHVTADVGYFYLTATFAISWLIGFLMPGAPAGLGVREGTMVLMLSDVLPANSVLTLIAGMRLATLIGDGMCFLISTFYLRLRTQGAVNGK